MLGPALILAAGCGHFAPAGKGWGEEAALSPGWSTLKRAAAEAAADPWTWVPAVGAAALQIGSADSDLAEDLRRETPLFGSADAAADASDWLRLGTLAVYAGLGLAAPRPDGSGDWRRAKARGFLAGGAALGATIGLTGGFKSITGRTRPNGEDDRSLPSGHTSVTAAGARLAADVLDHYRLSRGQRFAWNAGLVSLTAATGWARIEAGEHYPSDILLGAALGNFVARFAASAFLRPVLGDGIALHATPVSDGSVLTLYLVY